MGLKLEYIILVAWLLFAVPASSQDECSIEPADVVFVLDTSYSIWPPDFDREVAFMEKVIKTFNIGPEEDHTRVAALTFGHRVWPKFYLNTYTDVQSMLRACKRIKYGEGKTTNTGDALSYTRNIMLSERAGARQNSTKIVIVVSDGRSQKTWFTQNIAKTMQDSGIHLFAISVGFRLDHNELAGIASDPDKQYYFSIDKYSDMSYIKKTMEEKVCKEDFQDEAWNITDNKAEFRSSDEEVIFLDCEGRTADVFFMVDASYSINTENFAKEIEFIQNVVNIVHVGPNKTRVGLMTFSDDGKIHVKLQQNLTKENFMTYSNTAQYIGGGTDTGNALRLLREEGFYGEDVTQREGAAKILIVLTDGLSISPESTAKEAKLLKTSGVQIFSIGIGEGVDKMELQDIASEPADRFMIHVDDFGALNEIQTKLAVRACTVPVPSNYGVGLPFQSDNAVSVCHPSKDTDLLFVFDSQELGSWRSQAISQFISQATADFNLASDKLHVGREIENCPAGNVPLGGALQSTDLDDVRYQTFTDMLKRVIRNKLTPENGGRKDAYKMVVMFVDPLQKMNFDTYLAARTLQNSVDFFFVVSVGENMYTSRIARLAGDDNSIKVDNYDELPDVADRLTSAMCDFFFR